MPQGVMRLRERDSVCAECRGRLRIGWGGALGHLEYMLRCTRDLNHQGIMRPYRPGYQNIPGMNLYPVSRRRMANMEKELGGKRAVALRHYAQAVLQTREQAMEVLDTIWPDAPMAAKAKAALICIQYELNPLMKHVYLIKFESKKTGKVTWEPVLGIQANRLIAHRAGEFSYIDDTPRVMTKDEQQKVFAEVMEDRVWAITRVRDRNGNEASGYGFWLKAEAPYGQEKGNTKQNMAFIRSERQALDRLFAGKLPDVEVVDERFVTSTTAREVNLVTGEITGPEEEAEPVEAEGIPLEGPTQPPTAEELQKSKAEADKRIPQRDPATIRSLNDLFRACHDDFGGMQPKDVVKALGYTSQTDISESPQDCYLKIKASR